MRIRLVSRLSEIDAASWDALAGEDDPFIEHAFLSALEETGVVGGDSGWEPLHVTVWDGERLAGALPLYVKDHSFGEFIFDWAWADGAHRLGTPYYPKLVSMVPVTPATGRRLLVAGDVDRAAVVRRIVDGCFEAAESTGASSIHVLFLTEAEKDALEADGRLMSRLTHQFHWHSHGERTFDEFLARFRHSMRKQVKKERRRVREAGIEVRVLAGHEIEPAHWSLLYRLYRDTCMQYGSHPYLTRDFFERAHERVGARAVAVLALAGGEPIAGSLNFEKGKSLFGRYWGTRSPIDSLHFECCYYQLIERAIAKGMTRFEAGAQGTHKLRRGLEPSEIWSVHWVKHPILRAAIEDHLRRERPAVRRQMAELAHHGPFRRDGGEGEDA